jgi:hypothetical protein
MKQNILILFASFMIGAAEKPAPPKPPVMPDVLKIRLLELNVRGRDLRIEGMELQTKIDAFHRLK